MPKLNIGNSDFKRVRIEGDYFVDKSLLIKDVLGGNVVTLLLRPRRFGKTLNMTMLRYFFENTEENNAGLFEGLLIAEDADAMRHQGQYPVIYLNSCRMFRIGITDINSAEMLQYIIRGQW